VSLEGEKQMNLNTVMLSFLGFSGNPITAGFAWMTRLFYNFFGSYGLAIIALTIVIRAFLIPLNVRSQRSTMKQQALSSQQAEIRRRYPDNKQKQNEEITKLLQENGVSSFGGCLLPILQLFFILPIFYIVRAPLLYISQVSSGNLKSLGTLLKNSGMISDSVAKMASTNNIPIINSLQNSPEALRDAISAGYIKMSQMIDLKFMGLDLSLTPQFKPSVLFGSDWKIFVPLLLIPLLVLVTSMLQTKVMNLLKPNRQMEKEAKDAKERARMNPARKDQGQESSAESTMKMMVWLMPIIMLGTTFMFPAAMGFYWIVGNIMGILQQVIIFYLFTKPLEAKKAEMEILKSMAFTKNVSPEADTGISSGKKKK
jgi:YidC/Oxa1 family membrane protein insertase